MGCPSRVLRQRLPTRCEYYTLNAVPILTFSSLYFRKQIWSQSRRALKEQKDIHARLMARYPEVPQWWYGSIFCTSRLFIHLTLISLSDHVRLRLNCNLGLGYQVPRVSPTYLTQECFQLFR